MNTSAAKFVLSAGLFWALASAPAAVRYVDLNSSTPTPPAPTYPTIEADRMLYSSIQSE